MIDVSGPEVNLFAPLPEFAPAYAALHKSEPITCKSSGNTVSGLPPPMVAIVDVGFSFLITKKYNNLNHQPFAPYAFESIRATSQKTVPVITWLSAPAGPLLRLLGPVSLGGMSNAALETEAGLKEAKARVLQLQAAFTVRLNLFLAKMNFPLNYDPLNLVSSR